MMCIREIEDFPDEHEVSGDLFTVFSTNTRISSNGMCKDHQDVVRRNSLPKFSSVHVVYNDQHVGSTNFEISAMPLEGSPVDVPPTRVALYLVGVLPTNW